MKRAHGEESLSAPAALKQDFSSQATFHVNNKSCFQKIFSPSDGTLKNFCFIE